MRTYDFTPLFRSTVGFDRLVNLVDTALSAETGANTYPPYNIEKSSDDAYRISVAVAGFSEDELTIEMRDAQLVIAAKKAQSEDDKVTYLHRGIAARAFEKRFQLADHVRATGANVENGLLHIELVREVPEALKPRRIEIANPTKTIEAKKTAKVAKDAPIEV
ncbi:heat-shock protein IbpA [Amylibacter marinus]|uniref:Heat-shock protein IbpA n=1 Tax=Amylibacter marinus TaxID=1475483 RepID=A0ABQ5VUV3_9RHOB|nr:Hsp20 family protein [Amylibacter marinus]GLQ35217.1 heat-shock protein IbpA [Amylibacter marinus]